MIYSHQFSCEMAGNIANLSNFISLFIIWTSFHFLDWYRRRFRNSVKSVTRHRLAYEIWVAPNWIHKNRNKNIFIISLLTYKLRQFTISTETMIPRKIYQHIFSLTNDMTSVIFVKLYTYMAMNPTKFYSDLYITQSLFVHKCAICIHLWKKNVWTLYHLWNCA